MTRDELKQAIFDRLLSTANDDNRPFDAPVIDLDSIMSLVDAYSVGLVQDAIGGVMPRLPKPTEQEVRAWLAGRK